MPRENAVIDLHPSPNVDFSLEDPSDFDANRPKGRSNPYSSRIQDSYLDGLTRSHARADPRIYKRDAETL